MQNSTEMAWRTYSYIIICLVTYATSLPLTTLEKPLESDDHQETHKPNDADIFTQIIASNEGIDQLLLQGDIAIRVVRSSLQCDNCKWDISSNGKVPVPFTVSPGYTKSQLALITAAMQEFETLTCVDFVPKTNEKNVININNGNGCWSYIGRSGGVQQVSLSKQSCMVKGIIQHELNHVLGFVHEHVRSDRDQYVNVVKKNILPDSLGNFDIAVTNNLGLPYDYYSVMHYPRNAFSISPFLPTLITKPDPTIQIGQRYGLTNLDIAKINKLYNCDVCSTLLSDVNGTLFSPSYPSAYPDNANCVWLIRIPSNQVSVQFIAFSLQTSQNCVSDYVKIYDGATRSDPVLLDKACGSLLLPPITASSNLMLLEFVSNEGNTMTGFEATYSTVSCGGTYTSQSNSFSSPGYPVAYPPLTTCIWSIYAPVGFKIVLTINKIDVEYGLLCMYDSLTIYDGYNTTAPILRCACGNTAVPNQISRGRSMLLVFSSDISVQKKGFQASYTLISAN
uniref:Metalloendopeptidase n=2 Tax=Xenopus tropicalis TaxID=8364 RepID=F6YMH7_XENTR